jgi:simple sugar transport system ATP-binding protein
MEEKVVELRNIYKKFGNVNALNGVDLSLNKGEVLGLVGDNAAGKSTLCKILSGAYRPTSGGIIINNCEVNFDSPADAKNNHIEMVYQDLSLCNSIDVAGNLFLGREMHKYIFGLKLLDKNRMHSSSAKILKDLSIKVPSTKIKVEYLSGGQRQSIAIGKAVSFDPKVLIMDEPTSALAVAEVKAVLELIKTVSFKGVSVIFITHRLQDIFKVCDRVMVMYEGRKVADKLINETTLQDLVELIVSEH